MRIEYYVDFMSPLSYLQFLVVKNVQISNPGIPLEIFLRSAPSEESLTNSASQTLESFCCTKYHWHQTQFLTYLKQLENYTLDLDVKIQWENVHLIDSLIIHQLWRFLADETNRFDVAKTLFEMVWVRGIDFLDSQSIERIIEQNNHDLNQWHCFLTQGGGIDQIHQEQNFVKHHTNSQEPFFVINRRFLITSWLSQNDLSKQIVLLHQSSQEHIEPHKTTICVGKHCSRK